MPTRQTAFYFAVVGLIACIYLSPNSAHGGQKEKTTKKIQKDNKKQPFYIGRFKFSNQFRRTGNSTGTAIKTHAQKRRDRQTLKTIHSQLAKGKLKELSPMTSGLRTLTHPNDIRVFTQHLVKLSGNASTKINISIAIKNNMVAKSAIAAWKAQLKELDKKQ